ncbi:hypothetical protein IFM61606_03604 [Aspergillus udagawae]|uniref:Uncharacterized protein n=1 Tax=Aspergillus udagawae TaxID=91492 RepID=A0ABQ1A5B2_9EURO|nr:hypothetical protein IFM51744_01658 [Aspergillus udagawae]GFF73898.1 hypothetical protein IFM53868_01187 [Aspergillus udagawae]GFG23716.1 hypothetical protein IFM61606_03604 [Aspergillus udagawae]
MLPPKKIKQLQTPKLTCARCENYTTYKRTQLASHHEHFHKPAKAQARYPLLSVKLEASGQLGAKPGDPPNIGLKDTKVKKIMGVLRAAGSVLTPVGSLSLVVNTDIPITWNPSQTSQRCFKDAMKNGNDCVCLRDASFRKCRLCQRLGKTCRKIPLQLRRRVACRKFDDKLTAVTSFLRKQETPHLLRSLNRNVFRLLTVMSPVSGGRVPAPEEQVEFEMYEGEVADK